MRPTPPHLTSAAAESLLAQACENESQNAKRMRLGLEPLPVSRFENYAEGEPNRQHIMFLMLVLNVTFIHFFDF